MAAAPLRVLRTALLAALGHARLGGRALLGLAVAAMTPCLLAAERLHLAQDPLLAAQHVPSVVLSSGPGHELVLFDYLDRWEDTPEGRGKPVTG